MTENLFHKEGTHVFAVGLITLKIFSTYFLFID